VRPHPRVMRVSRVRPVLDVDLARVTCACEWYISICGMARKCWLRKFVLTRVCVRYVRVMLFPSADFLYKIYPACGRARVLIILINAMQVVCLQHARVLHDPRNVRACPRMRVFNSRVYVCAFNRVCVCVCASRTYTDRGPYSGLIGAPGKPL
jgi:hypothetical protein